MTRLFATFIIVSLASTLLMCGCTASSEKLNKKAIAEGKKLFHNKGCAKCHEGVNEFGASGGPDLSSHTHGDDSYYWVAGYLKNPQRVKPGTTMRKVDLSDDEINLLTVYVMSLRKSTPEQQPKR